MEGLMALAVNENGSDQYVVFGCRIWKRFVPNADTPASRCSRPALAEAMRQKTCTERDKEHMTDKSRGRVVVDVEPRGRVCILRGPGGVLLRSTWG